MNASVVLEGTWMYQQRQQCRIRVIRTETACGPADRNNLQHNEAGKLPECYHALYECPTERGLFDTGSAGFTTLEEAMHEAERTINQKVTWQIPCC